jgi:hypothetical protein
MIQIQDQMSPNVVYIPNSICLNQYSIVSTNSKIPSKAIQDVTKSHSNHQPSSLYEYPNYSLHLSNISPSNASTTNPTPPYQSLSNHQHHTNQTIHYAFTSLSMNEQE